MHTQISSLPVLQRHQFSSVQSITQSYPPSFNPMNCSKPGLPIHHQLPEFTQIHVHRVGDAVQPSHPLSSPSPPAFPFKDIDQAQYNEHRMKGEIMKK